MEYLYQFECEYHGNTILNGIKHFEEISVNLTITYRVLRRLTYHPELIRLALDYIRQNKDEILHKEAHCAHPILHELLHQSEILYHEKRLLNDERFDAARDNLEYFIKELQTVAPEFFEMTDTYGYLPIKRFDMAILDHPATQRIIKLLDFPDKTLVFPKRVYIDKTKINYRQAFKDGKWVDILSQKQSLDLQVYDVWDEVPKQSSHVQGTTWLEFEDLSNFTVDEFQSVWNEYDNTPILGNPDIPDEITLEEWYNKYYMYMEGNKVFVSGVSYMDMYTDIIGYISDKIEYLKHKLNTGIKWDKDSVRETLQKLDKGEFKRNK